MSLGHALNHLHGCFVGPEVHWHRCMSKRVCVRACPCICSSQEPGRCVVHMHPHAGTCVHVQASFVCVCALGSQVAWHVCMCDRGRPMCSWVHRFARAGMGDAYMGHVMAQS